MPILTPAQIIPLVDSIASPEYWTAAEFATVNLSTTYTAISVEAERRGWSDDENFRAFIREALGEARTAWEAANLTPTPPTPGGGLVLAAAAVDAGAGTEVLTNGTHGLFGNLAVLDYDTDSGLSIQETAAIYTIQDPGDGTGDGLWQIDVTLPVSTPATGASELTLRLNVNAGAALLRLDHVSHASLEPGPLAYTLRGTYVGRFSIGDVIFAQLVINNEADAVTIDLANSRLAFTRINVF